MKSAWMNVRAISENGGTKFNTWMDVIGSSDRKLIVNYHAVKVDNEAHY